MKKKKTIIGMLAIAIIGIIVFLFFHINDVRCLLINRSQQFSISKEKNVTFYASTDTPTDTLHILQQLIQKGINNNESFWKKKLDDALVIYCHNSNLYKKYGLKGFPAVTRLGTYVIIPSRGLSEEIISHELSHVQMYHLLDKSYWTYYYQLPCWFGEGVALQFNNSGVYSSKSMKSTEPMSFAELRKIDNYNDFYVADRHQLLSNYRNAKLEISNWLDKNGIEDLLRVVEEFKNGKDFYEAYTSSKIIK